MVDWTRQYLTPTFPNGNVLGAVVMGRATRQYLGQFQSSSTLYRGFDSGLNQFVTWTVNSLTPARNQTTPNYTGTLSDVHIEIP